MSALAVAVRVELRKALAARPVVVTAALFLVGLVAISAGMTLAAASGNSLVLARLGPLAAAGGWELYLGTAIQVAGAAGMLAAGVLMSFLVGREFTEGTITGLFAIPVPRAAILVAKVVVHLGWSTAVALATVLVAAVVGLALGLGGEAEAVAELLARLGVLVVLSGVAALPVALVATLARSMLAGIATSVVLLAATQIAVVAGAGPWFPIAAAALWAMQPAAVPTLAFAPALALPLIATVLTAVAWSRLRLNR